MKLLDLFSGIGGFHLGLEQAGFKFDWVGFSEIDKFAINQYKRRFPDATELGSVTDVQCKDLPKNIDILCGGFPCQSFSIAGFRKGFDDTRGTLFFEIARILRHYKESGNQVPYFILENVKGLLNHDDGRTFATIYGVLTDLDYTIECELLNTRNFSCPQNRERIYIVGHLRGGGRPKIFPIGKDGGENKKSRKKNGVSISAAPSREYGWKDVSPTLCARDYKDPKLVKVADFRTDEGIRIRDNGDAPCLTASHNSEDEPSRMQGLVIKPVLTPDRPKKRQNGRRFKDEGDDMFTLTAQDQHGIEIIGNLKGEGGHECHNVHDTNGIAPTVRHNHGKITMIEPVICLDESATNRKGKAWFEEQTPTINTEGRLYVGKEKLETTKAVRKAKQESSIRRLTPIECERLQGFPDNWTEGQSNTQRYRQLGIAVSVPVVKDVGKKIKLLDDLRVT